MVKRFSIQGLRHYFFMSLRLPISILLLFICLNFFSFYSDWIGICKYAAAFEDIPLGQRVLPPGMEQPRQQIRNVLGGFYSQNVTLYFRNSPYRVQSELIVESGATLTIETGVQMYFDTGVGLTVFGTIQAIGNEFAHIQMLPYQEQLNYDDSFPEFRLIDGPNVRQGRLQVKFRDRWRSVCNQLTNWTSVDTSVACRSMGYSNGDFWRYYRRNNDTYPFVMPYPSCLPAANNLWNCEGFANLNTIPLTENLCQGEDDLGLYCWGPPTFIGWAKHWKGLHIFSSPFNYVYADPDMVSMQRESLSRLEFIDILYAGYDGPTKNTTAALYIEGVPPILNGLRVENSARDGIRFYEAHGPIIIANSTIGRNRGHGIAVDNTVDARFFLNQSIISENFGDGVWYRQKHARMTQTQQFYGIEIFGNVKRRQKRHNSYYEKEKPRFDICAEHKIAGHLFFPHLIKAHLQNGTIVDPFQPLNTCWLIVSLPSRLRYTYTIQFIDVTNRNPPLLDSKSELLICDGNLSFPNVCQFEHYRIPLRDGVLPQSVSLSNNEKALFIGIEHITGNLTGLGTVFGDVDLLFKVHASVTYKAFYGLNITNSIVLNNTGNGVQAINIRDRTALSNVTVDGNQGLAGFLVRHGAADIWMNDTSFSHNWGDGVNISFAGGSINVNSSRMSGNRLRGFAFHHNSSIPFYALRHEIIIKGRPANNIFYPKMLVSDNLWGGILIGNICVPANFGVQPKILINWVEFVRNDYHPAIEIFSCQEANSAILRVDISGNSVLYGTALGLRVEPCVNAHLTINSNRFHNIQNSALLIRNAKHPQLWRLPAEVYIYKNDIKMNVGRQYVVSIGLNEDSHYQKLIFDQQNEVRANTVINPFPFLKSRSTPYAALVVSSSNVIVQHNCFGNPKADYEIGTELMEHSKRIDARQNNWGDTHPHNFMHRIFDQFNRYSLAVVNVNPFAAVCNQRVPALTYLQQFYRQFRQSQNPFVIGGTIFENSDLSAGTYTVTDDLHIMPGAKLTLASGVRLEFLNGVGMLVQGELLRTDYMNPLVPVIFTSKSFNLPKLENIRLVDDMGNEDVTAGRLEVRLDDGLWGTVCNRSWTTQLAQLTCNQLGLTIDPQYFENWRIFPEPGELPIRLDNVRCEEREFDLTKCRHDGVQHNAGSSLSCRPTEVVGIRCAQPHWAGVRYSLLANPPSVTGQVTMHNWIIEKAGLFDFRTSTFSPALQIDWNYHVFNTLTIRDNFYNGLDIVYNDLTKKPTIRNSYFARNRRNGIVVRSNGITIENVVIEGNSNAGVRYDARVDAPLQRDIVSWLDGKEQPELEANNIRSISTNANNEMPIKMPSFNNDFVYSATRNPVIDKLDKPLKEKSEEVIQVFESQLNQRMFLVAKPSQDCLEGELCVYKFTLQAVGHQFGLSPKLAIQIVNRCHNESDEDAVFFDPHIAGSGGLRPRSEWSARKNVIEFPLVSKGATLQMRYSRSYGRPTLVILVLFLDAQEYLDQFVHVYNSVIRRNQYAISAIHYSNLTFVNDGAVLTRYAKEKLWFQKVNFSQNIDAVLWVHSPQHEVLLETPIAQIGYHIDNCSFVKNMGPIVGSHRDLYSSANVFFWNFWSNTFTNNSNSGVRIQLPDTYDLLARQEHCVLMTENRFESNQNFGIQIFGYYAFANISSNNFTDNWSLKNFGILELTGMEKHLIIERNRFFNNWGSWMIRVETTSQSLRGVDGAEIPSFIKFNYFQFNHFIGKIDEYVDMWPRSYALGVFGTQKVEVHYNRFRNVLMDFELVAGCSPQLPGIESMNVTYNWWGVANEAEVSQRIFDLDDWNIYTVADYSPYYTSAELFINFWWDPQKAQSSFANYTEPSALDLKGRMFESKTLALDPERWYPFPYYYRPFRPYRITRDLTIMPGATLTIERNVEVHIWPNVRILVLGNLVADATLWQPVRFKPINATEFAEQHGRVGTRYRRFLRRASNPINALRSKRSRRIALPEIDSSTEIEVDDYQESDATRFWSRRRKQRQRNSDTLWWKRFRRRNKRHNIDSRFVDYQFSKKMESGEKSFREKRRNLKQEMIDVFRQFPEIRRENPALQQFSVFLTENGTFEGRSGFLLYYNETTGEIVPSCDRLFTLRNAQVVCRQLGFEPQNTYHWLTAKWDYFPLLRIVKTYVEPRECRGTESRLDKCELRLSDRNFNWQCLNSENFNYIHCGDARAVSEEYIGHWGGITFAPVSLDFSASMVRNGASDTSTSNSFAQDSSILRFIEIFGGGISHNDSLQAGALQIIRRSPIIENVNVTNSSMHAVQIISPTDNIILKQLNISCNRGRGINIVSANLHSSPNSNAAIPQGSMNLPYSLPGILNMCASGKTIKVHSRILVFYKYDSFTVDCVKIFRVASSDSPSSQLGTSRTLGFRFLQVNFFEGVIGIGRADALSIYSGANFLPTQLLRRFDAKTFLTQSSELQRGPNIVFPDQSKIKEVSVMSLHLRATAADGQYGFLAEISVLPSAPISKYVEEVALRNSRLLHNDRGALLYRNVGEIGPSVIVEQCSIEKNGFFLYGNVTSSQQTIELNLHNTILLLFRANAVRHNRGGMFVITKSASSVAQLNAVVKNNAFISNSNTTTLAFIGNNYQKINLLNNLIGLNVALYHDTVLIHGVSTNFTENLIFQNIGLHTIDMQSGSNFNSFGYFAAGTFSGVVVAVGSSTTQIFHHNSFVGNLALGHSFQFQQHFGYLPPDSGGPHGKYDEFRRRPKRQVLAQKGVTFDWWAHADTEPNRYRTTILAGMTSHQKFDGNIFDNPQNDYELTTSLQNQFGSNAIDARENYWGFPSTPGVAAGKIRDYSDYPLLSRVEFLPVLESNTSVVEGDCAAGFFQIGNEEFKSCFRFIGASMTYADAVATCEQMGAFMPILRTDDQRRRTIAARVDAIDHRFVVDVERYNMFGMSYDVPIWISSVSLPSHQCGWMSSRTASVGEQNCNNLLPFVCEKGIRPYQEPILWRQDIVMVVSALLLLFVLIIIFFILALCKAQQRKEDFANRKAFVRDSIRRKSQILGNFQQNEKTQLRPADSGIKTFLPPKQFPNFSAATVQEMNVKSEKLKHNNSALCTEPTKSKGSCIESETTYESCSEISSLRSEFCTAMTRSCSSNGNETTPTLTYNTKLLQHVKRKKDKAQRNITKNINQPISRLNVSMNPAGMCQRNTSHMLRSPVAQSDLSCSFTDQSASGCDESIMSESSTATSRIYSSCSSADTASTSTTSTLIESALSPIDEKVVEGSLINNSINTMRLPKPDPIQFPARCQNYSIVSSSEMQENNLEYDHFETLSRATFDWSPHSTLRASSRPDLSQRSLTNNVGNNLYTAYSNPSIYHDSHKATLYKSSAESLREDAIIKQLQMSPRSSFRRKLHLSQQHDDSYCPPKMYDSNNICNTTKNESIYVNLQTWKKNSTDLPTNPYLVYEHDNLRHNAHNYAPQRQQKKVDRPRPKSAASTTSLFKKSLKSNCDEITPLETSM